MAYKLSEKGIAGGILYLQADEEVVPVSISSVLMVYVAGRYGHGRRNQGWTVCFAKRGWNEETEVNLNQDGFNALQEALRNCSEFHCYQNYAGNFCWVRKLPMYRKGSQVLMHIDGHWDPAFTLWNWDWANFDDNCAGYIVSPKRYSEDYIKENTIDAGC